MSVAGLILSNLHDKELPALTSKRTMGAVPFGGRYRLVDFPLSAMVNAGLSRVFVIAHHNYQSLMEHIGSGKDWDMARHDGGIRIVPPYSAAYANPRENYGSRMQSLISVRGLLERIEEENVLCCDCDVIGTPDFSAFIAAHKSSGLPFTEGVTEARDEKERGLHIWIAKTSFLREILREAYLLGYTSFYGDVIRRAAAKGLVGNYHFAQSLYPISSLVDYYRLHMLLVGDEQTKRELLGCGERPVLTKTENSPPVKYGKNARVKNSLIADGCVVEGTVINSVLFRGVHVGAGCVVENSVVMARAKLSGNARLNGAVLDKYVTLGGDVSLSGHPTLPFFVEEGRSIQ